jgi:hypothetical protein
MLSLSFGLGVRPDDFALGKKVSGACLIHAMDIVTMECIVAIVRHERSVVKVSLRNV